MAENPQTGDAIAISVTDMFTIGIGPSSSHTVGPMSAGLLFAELLAAGGLDKSLGRLETTLFGSLAYTGIGHGTDKAIILGLSGETPDGVDPDRIDDLLAEIETQSRLLLGGGRAIEFVKQRDLLFKKGETLPEHPNGMRFRAFDGAGKVIAEETYFSIGGGFVVAGRDMGKVPKAKDNVRSALPFSSAAELLETGDEHALSIAEIIVRNEQVWRPAEQTDRFLADVRTAMLASIDRACRIEGVLPGGLNVKRRAARLFRELDQADEIRRSDPLHVLDWVNLYALAVNEENAAGGRVVTAPTNGAAGVLPAVLKYYETFCPQATPDGHREFLLTAAAIGMLYKKRASISAAEMGCQGEVGVACSMAAGALAAVLGGSNRQIENAAEIGMEHNLGLTCDPVGGLVQIPCIERNTMGAVKAINAARLALAGTGEHVVSLDKVIETMRQTGEDMQSKYKETSLGGLAVNVVEC
jgi:L-serine dehydratase